jgi:hypothetical protein
MGIFFVAMCYLKDFVYRAKGMCVFCQVFSKAWVTSIVVKRCLVFFVTFCESSTCLAYICHVAVGAY